MKKCINCGGNINDNALFCEYCGALQKEETENAVSNKINNDGSNLHEQKDVLGSLHDEINELLQGFESRVENVEVFKRDQVINETEISGAKKNSIDERDINKDFSENQNATDALFQIKNKTVEPQNEIDILSKKTNSNDRNNKKNKAQDLSGLAIAIAIFVFIVSCAMVISPKTFGFDNLDGVAEKWDISCVTDIVDAKFSEKISDAGVKIFGLTNSESETEIKDEKQKEITTDSENTDYKIIEHSGTIVKNVMIPGEVYEIDLNGDGEAETIQYKIYDYEGNDLTNDANWFMSQVDMNALYTDIHFEENLNEIRCEIVNGKIIINGNDTLNIEGLGFEPYILLTDFDFNDKYSEMLFEGFPSENEISTIVVRYGMDELEKIGEVPGSPEYGTTVDGSGMIKAQTEGWGICCWLYEGEYILVDGILLEVEKDKYYMDVKTTTLQRLDLYKSPGDYTVVESLESGENVTLVYSDKKRWCYVQPENGTGGFIEISGEFGYRVNGESSSDVFSDLPMWG